MALYHLRSRDDGQTDVIDGPLEGEGRTITTFPTYEEALIYLSELDVEDDDQGSAVPSVNAPTDAPAEEDHVMTERSEAALRLSGFKWSELAEGAIRLSGWQWSEEEERAFAEAASRLLSGFKWGTQAAINLSGWKWDSEPVQELTKLLTGWRWNNTDDPVEALALRLTGWRWSEGHETELAVKLLSGFKWGINLTGWRWDSETT